MKRCIGMINLPNLNGEALSDAFLSRLKYLIPPLETMVGRGYDGTRV